MSCNGSFLILRLAETVMGSGADMADNEKLDGFIG